METNKEKKGIKLIVCFSDKAKEKSPITLENPDSTYLEDLNKKGFGIFETANSFFATTEQLKELAIKKNKESVTKRNKEFLTCLNEVFADIDVCKDTDGISESVREKSKDSLKISLNKFCPPSVYVITKNGLQPRWWIDEPNIDEETQQKYVNITNGIIEWSKQNGAKGDQVKDVTRVLRKPGYYHQKSEPYLVIEEKGNEKIYTLDELKKYFWHEQITKNLSVVERKNDLVVNQIDLLDIRTVVIDVWKEKGRDASFDKDNHLIIDGVVTATFKGRLGGNYVATTSSDYPAKGNSITYVAETLNITNSEAFKWLCKKYNINSTDNYNKKVILPISQYTSSLTHAELVSKEFLPARYTVEPFFEQGTMNMVSAPPNTWKSWLLFLFAGHIVAGSSVLDKFSTTKANVMIVNEEDSARLIQDRLKLLKITDPSLPIYYRIAQGSKLTNDFVDFLIKEAKDKNIGVIMFDSLRAIHDADENSSTEIQGVMDLLKRISREDITVIFTHHHRKKSIFKNSDDKESSRGSSAINAAVSGHISLEEVEREDGKYLILKHLKSKVGEKLQPFDIEIKTDDGISFQYLGEHQPKEQALVEAKNGILLELQDKDELLGRKDFVQLKIAGTTTIRDATKILEKEGKIVVTLRRDAEKSGRRVFSNEGKANEKLYSLKREDDFGDYNDLLKEDT